MNKDEYIHILSDASDRYGSILVKMMDRYHADSLRELSEEQVKEFYEDWRKNNDRK